MNGIALSGKAGTGKDTIARIIMEHDDLFERVSFADQVKDMAGKLTGLNFHDEDIKVEYRWFLQEFGTDLMRKFDDNFWVKKTIDKCKQLNAEGKYPIVTDVRFPNEADALRREGMLLVRLEAMPSTREARGRPVSDHISETALDAYRNWDYFMITDTMTEKDMTYSVYKTFLERVNSEDCD